MPFTPLRDGGRRPKDNISPRIRHEYHANYYAADVLDPDGYSVEVVIKTPETGEPE